VLTIGDLFNISGSECGGLVVGWPETINPKTLSFLDYTRSEMSQRPGLGCCDTVLHQASIHGKIVTYAVEKKQKSPVTVLTETCDLGSTGWKQQCEESLSNRRSLRPRTRGLLLIGSSARHRICDLLQVGIKVSGKVAASSSKMAHHLRIVNLGEQCGQH